jgi:hypothetical protein
MHSSIVKIDEENGMREIMVRRYNVQAMRKLVDVLVRGG